MGCQELNQTTIFYQDFSDKDNNKLTEQAAEKIRTLEWVAISSPRDLLTQGLNLSLLYWILYH